MRKDPFAQFTGDDIKDKNLNPYRKDSDIDDMLSGKIKNESLRLFFEKNQTFWILAAIFFGFLLIIIRIGYVQLASGDHYRVLAEENRIRILGLPSSRGVIYDRNNDPLTKNIPNFYLQVIPSDLPDEGDEINSIIATLATDLGLEEKVVRLWFDGLPGYSYQPKILQELINIESAIKLKVKTANMPGVSLEMTAIREYPHGEILAHVLGYTGKMTEEEFEEFSEDYLVSDYIGKTGLELYYEAELKGANGKKEIEVDSLGKEKRVIASQEAEIGLNIITTLDLSLQQKLYEELDRAVSNSGGKGGAAIALDPRNGEVLAMVSNSSFDVNKFVRGISTEDYQQLIEDPKTPLFFKAVSGEYPSGSTIKPLIATAALEEGIISPSTTVNSVGGIRIDKWFFPDWKAGGHGVTNVVKALAESVNTFFYTIGGGHEDFEGLGVAKIKEYAQLFGLTEPSGIDLPSEADGFLPSKDWKEEVKNEQWYIGDTYHLAIGQGDLLVTPLQIANMTAIIANGGTYYRPHLLKQFSDSQNHITYEKEPDVNRDNFLRTSNLKTVQQGMRESVISGSSVAMGALPVSSAGKTGTAQYSEGTHAWFTCYAPYENPEIVITVVVEKGGGGETTALPVARNALLNYFNQ
ncbi:MAG: penicillin-binding protein 2 [Patescibacteria group bacterium]